MPSPHRRSVYVQESGTIINTLAYNDVSAGVCEIGGVSTDVLIDDKLKLPK